MTPADGITLSLQEIVKTYDMGAEKVHALDGVSLDVARNEYVAIMGPSGSGKSTLMNLIGDLSVYENVELPLVYRGGVDKDERRRRVNAVLERVGMAHRVNHYPSQLSGGQQQRVAVARALVGEPSILLADEPTGNLDSASGEAVMELMDELHQGGATICMVTHDPRYATRAARTIQLFDGQIVDEDITVENPAPAGSPVETSM
jgi:putative ABC transport system ATP-binding protein